MPRKTGLGRGLDALIGNEESVVEGIRNIPLDQIAPNPRQPRLNIDRDELAELTDSIREVGVLQPLIVTYDNQSNMYTLIAGGRRLLASAQAGLQTVPAIVRQASEQQRLELALVENIQRADLSPLESAEAYRQLVDEFGLSHEAVAARVGKSRVAVTNTLRLLKLPDPVKKALMESRISEGHARALLSLHTPEAQNSALHTILQRDLTVRQTEELVQKLLGQAPPTRAKTPPSPEIAAIENRLRSHLGTKVHLTRRRNGGTISIHFYSEEEFNSLIDKILGEED
jgi:ParB family transcriptional regulator, chromosome partitioning protein